jgi:hypothetical protein
MSDTRDLRSGFIPPPRSTLATIDRTRSSAARLSSVHAILYFFNVVVQPAGVLGK